MNKRKWLQENKECIICEPSGWKWLDLIDQEKITKVCFANEESKNKFLEYMEG